VERASALAKEKGARRAVMLPVSAPFHCALMQPAQEEVARVLARFTLSDPSIPVAANVTGRLLTAADAARDALIRQVTGAVRWVDCMQALIAAGPTHFIEVGPGKVLCGLLKQIDPAQKSLNVEDAASLEATLSGLV
jgi:[acyl-carrier-protein] S-malonyltransferase